MTSALEHHAQFAVITICTCHTKVPFVYNKSLPDRSKIKMGKRVEDSLRAVLLTTAGTQRAIVMNTYLKIN